MEYTGPRSVRSSDNTALEETVPPAHPSESKDTSVARPIRPTLLRQLVHVFDEFIHRFQSIGSDDFSVRVQEQDSGYDHFFSLFPEFVGMRPANDDTNELLGRFHHCWIVKNLRERTALESGGRSSGLRAG